MLAEYSYLYDAADRLVRAAGPGDTATYHYDPAGQLTFADHSAQPDESYGYDKTGNRNTADDVIGAGNRLLEDATYIYEYDDEGNRTKRTDKATGEYTTYEWDYENRLTEVAFYSSTDVLQKAVAYKYDALGRRIDKLVDDDGLNGFDETETYVYDSPPGKGGLDDVVLTFDGSGNVKHRYLHGPAVDQVFADEDSLNEVLWGLADRQGSMTDWVEYDGATGTTTVSDHIEYNGFGNIASQSNPNHEVFYAYAGRIWDAETETYDFRNRVYVAAAGTFLSEDPSGFAAGDVNLRRYVGNSPTNYTDPSGRIPVVIYANLNAGGAPPSRFNPNEVEAIMEKTLKSAGLNIDVQIVVTEKTYQEMKGQLGCKYPPKKLPAVPWWLWVVNSGAAAFALGGGLVKNEATSKPKLYNFFVDFKKDIAKNGGAQSGDDSCNISEDWMRNRLFDNGPRGGIKPNWDVIYANTLLHEVFHYGVLNNHADVNGSGSFSDGGQSPYEPVKPSPKEVSGIKDALGI